MSPPPRAKQAIAAMSVIGFPSKVCTPVLKRLLKLYDCNYDFIEDNGYQVLIDSILEEQKKAANGKNENPVADDNCKQSRKRAVSSHEVSISLSKHKCKKFGEFTTKKQKMESDVDAQKNYIAEYPSKGTSVEAGNEIPISLSAIPPCQQNQDANDGLQHNLIQVSSSSRSEPVLEANDNAPLATQSTTPRFDVVSEKQVAEDTSLRKGRASEFDTSRKTSTLAFSDGEDVKLLLNVNPNALMPRLDTVIKATEKKYLKCYMLSDPEFSLKKILKDMCQCASELSPKTINSEQENAVMLSCDEGSKDTQEKDKNNVEGKEIKEQKKINCSSQSLHVLGECIKPWHYQDDISKGKERVKISFVNEYSNEETPPPFYYTPKSIVYQNAFVNFSLARVGDEDCCSDCFGDCVSAPIPCPCARETGGEFAYRTDGLLKPSFLDGCMPINSKPQKHRYVYCQDCPLEHSKKSNVSNKCKGHIARKFIKECWIKCGCSKQCTNRVVQHGISRRLQVFFTPEGKGWGLRTLEELPRGAFVCEYVGEILTTMELHGRTIQTMVNAEHTYPVLLDADWGSERQLKDDEALCLDAAFYGNVARFVNHRCVDANMVEVPVEIETPDRHYYHLAFFTTRDVEPYEELTWDYGIDFDDVDRLIKAFKCCCGSKLCRDTKRSKVEPSELDKNCSEIQGSSLLPVPLTIVEEEATPLNRIHDDITGSSSHTIHDEIQGTTSDHLLFSVESETTELNKRCSEVPKSASDLIIASIEVEPNEQNETCNTNSGLASDILPSIEAEAAELDKMVDGVSDDLPSSVVEKEPSEQKSKSSDICDSMSVLAFNTLATATAPSSMHAEETSKIFSNTDPSIACTANLGLRTDYVPLSRVEEELNESNGTSILSFDSPVRSLIEAREIIVSNETNETYAETPPVTLPATENETVAESVTIGMAAVESIEPHGCSAENLEPKSILFSKENEIIASKSVVDVVQEHAGPSSCPVKTDGENPLSNNNIASVYETENTIVSNTAKASAENCKELAGQSPLPSPPSSSKEVIGSLNLHSGNVHAQQPVIVNENLNLGHSNDSSHPFILHPSPPLETEENNTGTSSASLAFQILPITSIIHPLDLHPNPLQNELTRIHKHIEMITKVHEEKKLKTKLECEQELEKVRKKYDAVLEEDERGFNKDRKILETVYRKLVMNQKLAEQFGCWFMGKERPESSGGRPVGPTMQFNDHQVQMTQASPTALGPTPQFHHRVHMTTASPAAPGPTLQFRHQMQMPQVRPTTAGPALRAQPPHLLHRFRPSSTLPSSTSSTVVRHDP